jgi:hypothetical protein
MAISEAYANSASVSTTEYSLTNNSTTIATQTDDGVYQVFLDLNALAAGDEYQIRVLEKVQSAGTQRAVFVAYVVGAQGELWCSPSLILLHGWDVTLKKISGTDRTIEWSIRKVA